MNSLIFLQDLKIRLEMNISRKNIFFLTVMIMLLSPLPFFTLEQKAHATSIGHAFSEMTTAATSTSTTYVDVDTSGCPTACAQIDSSSFVAGDIYLIFVSAQFSVPSTTANSALQLMHGSTAFEGSEQLVDNGHGGATANKHSYTWFTKWTAVSSEAVKLQMKTSANTITVDQVAMTAIRLSALQSTDYNFQEQTTDVNPAQSNFADDTSTSSITFTPNGSDSWLVMGTALLSPDSTGDSWDTRLNVSGGATDTGLIFSREGEEATNERILETIVKVYTPTNTSTTFEVETQNDAVDDLDGGVKYYSAVFALRLNAFKNFNFAHTVGAITPDTTDTFSTSTEVATATLDPNLAGDVWFLATLIYDKNISDTTEPLRLRTQFDTTGATDEPATQTSDNYTQLDAWDTTDQLSWSMQSVETVTDQSYVLDVDVTGTAGLGEVEERLALILNLDLQPTYVVDLLDLYESESNTLGAGNSLCQNVDLESGADECTSILEVGHSYRFEVAVRNDAYAGSPTKLDMDVSIGSGDVLGSIPSVYIINSGCSTNTDWTESIVSSTDVRGSSGTVCSISTSGTTVFWVIVRIENSGGGGVKPTATFTITDDTVSDTSTTTTFNVNNILEANSFGF